MSAQSPMRLPNDMVQVRLSSQLPAQMSKKSGIYPEVTIDTEFWNGVMRQMQQQPDTTKSSSQTPLLEANLSSNAQSIEHRLLAKHAPLDGTLNSKELSEALCDLGADCSEELASALIFRSKGDGESMSASEFCRLVAAVQTTISRTIISARLRSRTPERDNTVQQSVERASTSQSHGMKITHQRSPSPHYAARARSPSVGSNTASIRSGAPTLKSKARTEHIAALTNGGGQTPNEAHLSPATTPRGRSPSASSSRPMHRSPSVSTSIAASATPTLRLNLSALQPPPKRPLPGPVSFEGKKEILALARKRRTEKPLSAAIPAAATAARPKASESASSFTPRNGLLSSPPARMKDRFNQSRFAHVAEKKEVYAPDKATAATRTGSLRPGHRLMFPQGVPKTPGLSSTATTPRAAARP